MNGSFRPTKHANDSPLALKKCPKRKEIIRYLYLSTFSDILPFCLTFSPFTRKSAPLHFILLEGQTNSRREEDLYNDFSLVILFYGNYREDQ